MKITFTAAGLVTLTLGLVISMTGCSRNPQAADNAPTDLRGEPIKTAWIEMSDDAEAKMLHLADSQPDLPIGVAFLDTTGHPGWIGDDPSLRIHAPPMRGCWPTVHGTGS